LGSASSGTASFIADRTAGVDETCRGTEGSNSFPSSEESCELRCRTSKTARAAASDPATGELKFRIHSPPADSRTNLIVQDMATLAFISPVRPGSGRGQIWRSRTRQEPKALRPGTHTPNLHLWSACTRPSWESLRHPSLGRRTSSQQNACPFPFKSRRRHDVRRARWPRSSRP
jgi:hypothetical protein